jgi:hypothetical protein
LSDESATSATRPLDEAEAPGDLAEHLTTAVLEALQALPISERVDKANAGPELPGRREAVGRGH